MAVASKFSVQVLTAVATAWQNSDSVSQVVEKTKLAKENVMECVTYLRQKGYDLKNMRTSATQLTKEQIDAFVVAWNGSTTMTEVAEKLGIDNAEVAKQKRQVVKSGATLNMMRARINHTDLESALNGILAKIETAVEAPAESPAEVVESPAEVIEPTTPKKSKAKAK